METEKAEFSLPNSLLQKYQDGKDPIHTQARVAIDQITQLIQEKTKGKKLKIDQNLLYIYGFLGELIHKNQADMIKLNLYLRIYSDLISLIFGLGQKYENLKGKSMAILQRNSHLENILNKILVENEEPSYVKLLKFIIYSKDDRKFKDDVSQKSMENLLKSVISENQRIRKEALRAFLFMFERDLHKNSEVMSKVTEFILHNLDNWFMKKSKTLYILFFLNSMISFLFIDDAKSVIASIMSLMEKKSPPDLRKMGCVVIEKLFEVNHIQTSYTQELLHKLVELSQSQFYSASGHEQVVSMIQVIVQVYLNFNRGTPYKSKNELTTVLNCLSDLLAIKSDQQTSFALEALYRIRVHATKSMELVLIESCDEFLLNPSEEIDLFSAFEVEKNPHDDLREKHGVRKMGRMTPRMKLFLTLKSLTSERFEPCYPFILQIFNTFFIRLGQLDLGEKLDLADELVELLVMIKKNIGWTDKTQKCLGKIVKIVSLDHLLNNLPIQVCDIDMEDPEFDEKSNSWVLSLLSQYKTDGNFPLFYQFLWPELKTIHEKIEMQAMFDGGEDKDKMILQNYKLIRDQLFTVLRGCTRFPLKYIEESPSYFKDLLRAFLECKDLETSEKLAQPLQQVLIFVYNNRNEHKKVYKEIKDTVKASKLFVKLCKSNNKIEKNQRFVASLIKILVLMMDRQTVEKIFKSNIDRLSKFITSNEISNKNNDKTRTNLRDIDTIQLFLESFTNIHQSDLFQGLLTFIRQMLETHNHQLWKKGVFMAEILLKNVHSTYAPEILAIIDKFYQTKLTTKKKQKKSKKNKKVAGTATTNGMDDEETEATNDDFDEETVGEGEQRLGDAERKVKDLVIRFLGEFVKAYFITGIKEKEVSEEKAMGNGESSLTKFAAKYLPVAIVSLKSRSAKTRDNSKRLLIRLDKAYEAVTKENTFMINLIVAGLAGKTSLMKSSTILALAMIFAKKFKFLEQNYVEKLIEVILIVIKEKNKETYKSIVAFFKFYVKVAEESTLRKQLPIIIGALFKWDEASQESQKNVVRTLLTSIHKRIGKQDLLEVTPENHHKLVIYIDKQDKRQANMRVKLRQMKHTADGERQVGGTFDLDFFENQISRMLEGKKPLPNAGGMDIIPEVSPTDQNKNLLLKFDSFTEQFHFTKHNVFNIQNQHKMEEGQKEVKAHQNKDIYFDEVTGKLIIKEREKNISGFKRKKDYLDKQFEEMDRINEQAGGKKRLKAHDTRQGQTLAAKMIARARKRNTNELVHSVRESGLSYRAKKGTKGDVRIPGRPNPHAFIQLNPIALQKKYRDRASQVFDYLMSKTKRAGMLKGLKSKFKR